ncbi:hypothetical protein RclHR1_01680025 [Rhizophagus clarus]|uniref:Uncharacterized protein n=1 Tax=Rhizophagus clarus TaxID=94130 RepID=A0A2Z6QXF0_9GLOM|nr:hypothetical protein RclHR1_01680025 [Rhizophagus clarus]GES83774.1 hypothetical protein RCL_e4515_RclHR1_01680025 [Rhizophagus clarus]
MYRYQNVHDRSNKLEDYEDPETIDSITPINDIVRIYRKWFNNSIKYVYSHRLGSSCTTKYAALNYDSTSKESKSVFRTN